MSQIDKFTNVFDISVHDLSLSGWHALFRITNNRHDVTITTRAISDSAEPRLESFRPPFVPGIDLPYQDVVDSYNL